MQSQSLGPSQIGVTKKCVTCAGPASRHLSDVFFQVDAVHKAQVQAQLLRMVSQVDAQKLLEDRAWRRSHIRHVV